MYEKQNALYPDNGFRLLATISSTNYGCLRREHQHPSDKTSVFYALLWYTTGKDLNLMMHMHVFYNVIWKSLVYNNTWQRIENRRKTFVKVNRCCCFNSAFVLFVLVFICVFVHQISSKDSFLKEQSPIFSTFFLKVFENLVTQKSSYFSHNLWHSKAQKWSVWKIWMKMCLIMVTIIKLTQ